MQRTLSFLCGLALLASCDYGAYEPNLSNDFESESPTGDQHNDFKENPFVSTDEEPISTFSIDADGASYSYIRRFLNEQMDIPPRGAMRTEEVINYFPLDYPAATGPHPVAAHGEVSSCPWNDSTRIVRIGMQGKDFTAETLPASNWVLLVDVSGSMSSSDKLPLLQEGFNTFVDQMRPEDRLAIVAYAGVSGVVLESTSGRDKRKIRDAIDDLTSGGGTAGAEGILTAYDIAEQNFITGGNNRVILGTDGDFNVGPSSQDELVTLIEENRDRGIYLTVLGYGTGNLQSGTMEQLANNGNGNFEYIDSREQSQKVFQHEFSKFYTVAKDVKVQVEWNPNMVERYRLIGYENRLLENEDFEDDTKDAGEIGAGQNITALYEIVPRAGVDFRSERAFTFRFRYKQPDGDASQEFTLDVTDNGQTYEVASENHRFVVALAGWVMLMWDSEYKEGLTYDQVEVWGKNCLGYDPHGYRQEWLEEYLPLSEQYDETD